MKRLRVIFLAISVPVILHAQGFVPAKIYINGNPVHAQPMLHKGIVYLPVEPVAVSLKLNVFWNPDTQILKINGKIVKYQVLMNEGVLYVPVEAAARSAGALVEWDGAKRIIRIRTGKRVFQKPRGSVVITTKQDETEPQDEAGPQEPPPPEDAQPGPPADSTLPVVLFVPRTSANNDFSVTVTNIEETHLIKDYYKPREGKKFVVLHLSEQNISDKVQMYSGRFSLEDQNEMSYDYLDGLSNFYLQILRPGGINFGALVFEVPETTTATKLVLRTFDNSPMIISLR